jgi:hypothetical protein
MPRNKIAIFDRFGNATQANGGVPISGPAIGARNISYIPEGAIVSGIGIASFEVPLQFAQNNAISKDTQIMIYQSDVFSGPVFWGRVIRRPRTLANDGTYVRVECQDVLFELASVTVTSGFISKPGELANAMLQRLVARQTETVWLVQNTLASASSPVTFSAYGIEVLRAIGKYASEHFASYKRVTAIDPVTGKPRRMISIGQYSNTKSGIRIINAPREWGSVPEEKKPAEIRIVKSATFEDDTSIVNRLIPTAGSDIAAASITLFPLYGRTDFVGYNPLYPIKYRPREDAWTDSLFTPQYFEFYIENTASIAAHRLSEKMYPRQDIVPLSTSATDVEVAATTLYAEAVQYIQDHINPHLSLDITTDHRGDLRNIGGTTVYVRCQAKNKDGDFVMDIEGDYRVQTVEISNADTEGNCKWTLSTDGRSVETNDVLFVGALEDIDYLKKVPTLLLGFPVYPFDEVIESGHDVTKTFVNSSAFISTAQVILDLRFNKVRSAIRPLTHKHTFTLENHVHSMSIASHTHSVSMSSHTHGLSIPDHTHPLSEPDHGHGMSVADHSHGASNGDHDHTMAPGSHSHHINNVKVWIDPVGNSLVDYANVGKNGERVVTNIRAGTYGDHTHGESAASGATGVDAATAGAFNIGTSGYGGYSGATGSGGGFNGSTSGSGGTSGSTGSGGGFTGDTGGAGGGSFSTGGAGGISTSTGDTAGAEWGLIEGLISDIIRVYVNGVYFGDYTNDVRVDITRAWHTNTDNVVLFQSIVEQGSANTTGLGRISGAVLARMIGSTLANQTL